jgi:oxygen-independent coproporphyrinogen-3 oxidase
VNRHRWKNAADTAAYMKLISEGRTAIVESEELDDRKWLFERVALELRVAEGMSLDRVGMELRPKLKALAEEGLLVVTEDRIVLTRRGKALADAIAETLLPDD